MWFSSISTYSYFLIPKIVSLKMKSCYVSKSGNKITTKLDQNIELPNSNAQLSLKKVQ
jgi:hypothetical protein